MINRIVSWFAPGLLVFASLVFAAPAPAGSIHGSIVVAGLCPYGSSLGDGCPGAPVADNVTSGAGTYQFPNMMSATCAAGQIGCAKQSVGQTYSLQATGAYPNRAPWNIAYVDYPLGIPASSLPLKDPANIHSDQSACTWTGVYVSCYSTSGNVTIDGYDFSLHNGTNLNISLTGSTSAVVLKNNYFATGSAGAANADFTQIYANSLLATNNVFDGGGGIWTSQNHIANGGLAFFALSCDTNGNCPSNCGTAGVAACVQYNTFIDIPNRAIISGGHFSAVYRYNAIDGIGYPSSRFTGYIDDNSTPGTYSGNPGNILTITDIGGGATCTASLSANCGSVVVDSGSGFSQLQGLQYPVNTCRISALGTGSGGVGTYTLSGTGCTSIAVTSSTMYWNAGQHGDTTYFGFGTGTMPLMQISYNTILLRGDFADSTAGITLQQANYISSTVTTMSIDHNTIIGNLNANLWKNDASHQFAAVGGASIGDNASMVVTNPTVAYNYYDSTGFFKCTFVSLQAGSGTLSTGAGTLVGNQNMLVAANGDSLVNTNLSACQYGSYP